jgi:hypothetical protein
VHLTLRRIIVVATTFAVPAVRVSGRPAAAGHPVLDFVAADQASDLLGRPGSAGRLGLDCSCDCLDWGVKIKAIDACGRSPWPMMLERALKLSG